MGRWPHFRRPSPQADHGDGSWLNPEASSPFTSSVEEGKPPNFQTLLSAWTPRVSPSTHPKPPPPPRPSPQPPTRAARCRRHPAAWPAPPGKKNKTPPKGSNWAPGEVKGRFKCCCVFLCCFFGVVCVFFFKKQGAKWLVSTHQKGTKQQSPSKSPEQERYLGCRDFGTG